MKYDFQINKGTQTGGDGYSPAAANHARPVAVARRFPPVVQVLTGSDPTVQQQLTACAAQAYRAGKPLKEICGDVYHYSRSLGFEATIGVQEVYSTSMPSFPGQTVISALLMVDMRPLWPGGERARSRMSVAG